VGIELDIVLIQGLYEVRYRPFYFKTIHKIRSLPLKSAIDDVEGYGTTIYTGNIREIKRATFCERWNLTCQ
jgi:hypothetical protein